MPPAVKVGTATLVTIDETNRFGEFLFYIDGSGNPHWVCIASNQTARQLP